MRVLKSSFVYPDYPDFFYRQRNGLAGQSFSQQMAALLADGFSFGDSWKHYLESTGHHEVMEVVLNAAPAQRQWARERGVRYSENNEAVDILAAQLTDFKPDVWFCHSWIAPADRLRLRRSCPSIRYVIGYDGSLKHDPKSLEGCDAVLTCVRKSAEFYSRVGMKGYWLPWGFDPRIAERLAPPARQGAATFTGSTSLRNDGHFGRVELLDTLLRQFEVSIHVPDLRGLGRQALSSVWHADYSSAWKILRHYPALRRLRLVNTGALYGLSMFQLLSESRVVLNLHGDKVTTAANIRLFEVTGVGSCLLTDWKSDISTVFEPDREVVTFRSAEECVDKLRYLLDHEGERQAIAAAGRARCLRDYHLGKHILAFASDVLDKL